MYRRTRSCLARGQSTFCSYSVTTLLTTYRICIRRFVASLFEGALRPPLDWGERPPPGLWRPWSLARRSFSEGGRSKDAKPGRSNAGAGTRECGLIELVRWECNPTIDYACPGCGAARSGAPLIRDRHGLERSTQVGFTRLAHIGRRFRVNPRSVSAEKQENTGIGPTGAAFASLEASS